MLILVQSLKGSSFLFQLLRVLVYFSCLSTGAARELLLSRLRPLWSSSARPRPPLRAPRPPLRALALRQPAAERRITNSSPNIEWFEAVGLGGLGGSVLVFLSIGVFRSL